MSRARVLCSFGPPERGRNPFTALLAASLAEHVDLTFFSWRAAFALRYDVFHVHWPEGLLRDPRRRRRALQWAAFMVLLGLLRITRKRVVWTVHNLQPHADRRRSTRIALAVFERSVDLVIVLLSSDAERFARLGQPVRHIPHGHYRDHYRFTATPVRDPGRIAMVGLLRPYKRPDALIDAFRDSDAAGSLVVAGRPMPAGYGEVLTRLAATDPRIDLRLGYQSDDDVVALLEAATVSVLPYRDLHSSGAALLSLSAGVPVLLPRSPAAEEMSAEVGGAWVQVYDEPLTAADLDRAVRESEGEQGVPDLSNRDWDRIGVAHLEAYLAVLGRR